MRHADTATLAALNDQAVALDFNEWLPAELFDRLARDGQHVLALAIPHGVRPGSIKEWPPHYRTMWFVETATGAMERVNLDLLSDDLEALPEIPDTPSENPFLGQKSVELPPVVQVDTSEGPWLMDGKYFVEALRRMGVGSSATVTAWVLEDVSRETLIRARNSIREPRDEYQALRERVHRRMSGDR